MGLNRTPEKWSAADRADFRPILPKCRLPAYSTEVRAGRPGPRNRARMHRKTTRFGCNDRRRALTILVR
jgi:hypothetical protein